MSATFRIQFLCAYFGGEAVNITSDCGNIYDSVISVIYTREHAFYIINRGKLTLCNKVYVEIWIFSKEISGKYLEIVAALRD